MKLFVKDIAVSVLLCCAYSAVQATPVQFVTDTSYVQIQDGHIRLDWTAGGEESISELQRAETVDFHDARTIYRGPDRASFISGLPDGLYYFRVREEADAWSDVLTVEVKHQSLRLAFTLFGIGAVVFLLTVGVVVHGALLVAKTGT